jgi:quercetin dioxygenase-like cupin family protein
MSRPHVVGPQDGTPITEGMTLKIRRTDLPTGGLGVIEGIVAPGQLIAPHVHTDVDEVTYVLAGEITAEIGGEVVVAAAGSYVFKPYGVMHAFWNATNEPARVMELHLPGGFEQFYADMTAVASDTSLGQHARMMQMEFVSREYRVEHHPELTDDLKRRHGLR